ncbi:hypothetical protein SIPHO049v1_p0028 [Vibrio phage PS14A.1]|nr:hypothetical protein SIPHO049v1_p0028 [Vibrio phage PS14A.1]
MATKYYKTNNPEVLAAYAKMMAETDRLVEASKKFAALFGATNLMNTSMTGRAFGGLVFDSFNLRDDKHLWTKPDRHGRSWPRSSLNVKSYKDTFKFKNISEDELKANVKQAKADLVELRAKYKDNSVGMERVSFDDFFKSFGTDWGNLMFSGLQWMSHDDHIYFASGADFSKVMTEILGSEYELAELANKG